MNRATAIPRLATASSLAVVALLAWWPAALAASHPKAPAAEQTRPRMRPLSGGPRTTFVLTLRIADDLGVHGVVLSDYAISTSNVNTAAGCRSAFGENLNAGRRGQRFTVKLTPEPKGWCRGRYRGVVLLERGPYCAKTPGKPPQPCPAFATQALDVGRFSFTVR